MWFQVRCQLGLASRELWRVSLTCVFPTGAGSWASALGLTVMVKGSPGDENMSRHFGLGHCQIWPPKTHRCWILEGGAPPPQQE